MKKQLSSCLIYTSTFCRVVLEVFTDFNRIIFFQPVMVRMYVRRVIFKKLAGTEIDFFVFLLSTRSSSIKSLSVENNMVMAIWSYHGTSGTWYHGTMVPVPWYQWYRYTVSQKSHFKIKTLIVLYCTVAMHTVTCQLTQN